MSIIAVTYSYNAPEHVMDEIRPVHREFLATHPGIRLTGPTSSAAGGAKDGALLIFEGDLEWTREWLQDDPFHQAGFIDRVEVVEWAPAMGSWKPLLP